MSFLRGALVLTLAGLCSKIISPVPGSLSYLLGAEGIGLYQDGLSLYSLAFVLAAAGIPHCRGETKCRRDSPAATMLPG